MKEKLSAASWLAAHKACHGAFQHAMLSRRLFLAQDILKRATRFADEYKAAVERELEHDTQK